MKRLLIFLLALTLVLAVIGCKNDQKPPQTDPGTAAQKTDPPGEPKDTTKPAEKPDVDKSEFDKLDKIYLGSVTPITGAKAASGDYNKKGIDLWVEEVNAAGGILGKQVEVIYEDTQSTEAGSANAYQKLASRGDITAIHNGQFSNEVLATLPYVKQYKIPSMCQGSSVKISEDIKQNPHQWQIRINDAGAAYAMVDALVDELKAKKIALIHDTDAFGQGLADNAVKALEAKGMKPEIILSFPGGEKQFTGYLSQIKDKGCDGILMMAHPNEAALIQIGVNSMGLKDLLKVGSPDASSAVTIELSKDDANGWYTISDWVPTTQEEPGKTFEANFQKKYNEVSSMDSAVSYDIMSVFKAAIEKAGSQDPKAVQDVIGDLDPMPGCLAVIDFNENHTGATSQYLCRNENRVPVIISKIDRVVIK